jgi:hypothetical protein
MTLMIEALREVIKRKHYPLERVANFEGQCRGSEAGKIAPQVADTER